MAKKKKDAPKKGKRRIKEEEDDEDLGPPKPRAAGIFTGLTLLTFLALAGAGTFFYIDFDERSDPAKQLAPPEVSMIPLLSKGAAPPVRPPVTPATTPSTP